MSQRYFDPEGLARVGHMELVARQVVEGFLTGRHRSPYHGFSVEYLDHRPYTPGDEIRSLDWKILARTDKYHVKLFQDETNLRATILLDCSKSMAFQSGKLSKLQWGSYLAAALTHLLLRQNDAVGLQLFRHNGHEVIVFHVLDDVELTFPYDRLTRFKDMEGSGRVVANAKALR